MSMVGSAAKGLASCNTRLALAFSSSPATGTRGGVGGEIKIGREGQVSGQEQAPVGARDQQHTAQHSIAQHRIAVLRTTPCAAQRSAQHSTAHDYDSR